eukprot:14872522-Ditylum_brightwellii.AAC.1
MKESDCYFALLDYYVEQGVQLNNLTANNSFKLNDITPHTALTEVLGHVLGPAKGEGSKMAQWAMKGNGNVAPS